MQEFDTPLRLTWEIAGKGAHLDAPRLLKVADAIAEAGVLFVTLEGDPLHHPAAAQLLERLAAGGCQVTAVVADPDGLDAGLPLAEVALDAGPRLGPESKGLGGLAAVLEEVRGRGFEPLLWLAPYKSYLTEITKLFRFCAECGVGRFKLSNLPISASFARLVPAEIPRPEDLQPLATELREAAGEVRGRVRLEVHDRFLWETLAEQSASLAEYGGCQAANSLAHVDAGGNVHPCSSWPERLGNLLVSSFEELWRSEPRRSIRQRIAEMPDSCAGCRDYQECFAGCRGLSACCDFANEGRDPLCGGRR